MNKCWIKIVHLLEPIKTVIENARWKSEEYLLIFKISSTCFAQTFAHRQERKTANYSMFYGVLL
jgi:hypothetical protein